MADSKLATRDPIENASPISRPKGRDAPVSRSERKDKSKSSGSVGEEPAGPPPKLEFGDGEGKAYSPRNINPETQFVPKQVPQLIAVYEEMQGVETDGEATQRHNKEAEEEKAAKQALHRAEA